MANRNNQTSNQMEPPFPQPGTGQHSEPEIVMTFPSDGGPSTVEVFNGDTLQESTGKSCRNLTAALEASQGEVIDRKSKHTEDDGRDRRTRRTINDRQRV